MIAIFVALLIPHYQECNSTALSGSHKRASWIAAEFGLIGEARRRSGGAWPLDRRILDAGRTHLDGW